MTLVGRPAPKFSVQAMVQGNISDRFQLDQFAGKYVLLFFYPLDFTFVCPTELHAFQEALPAFQDLEVHIIGCSVDSVFSHLAWWRTPKSQGGIQGIDYPLLADLQKTVARSYGVLKEEDGIAYRGWFLIDREGIIRHELVNDLPLGRSIAEALRIVHALREYEQHGEVCPANWQQGRPTLHPTQEGVVNYLSTNK